MNPDSTRKAIRRSILKQEGVKRVEVVLDAGQLSDLEAIKQAYGYNTAEAVSYAISAARVVMARDSAMREPETVECGNCKDERVKGCHMCGGTGRLEVWN